MVLGEMGINPLYYQYLKLRTHNAMERVQQQKQAD
jgi:hypothetical protein